MYISQYLFTMRNLMEIKRYQNKLTLSPSSIAEHKFTYSKIAYILSYWESKIGKDVKNVDVLEKAILNGTIKAITGDIQSNTLKVSDNLFKQIKKTYEVFYQNSYKPLLPEHINIKNKVLNSKDESIEGCLIKLSSLINKLFEVHEEVSLGNKYKFQEILDDTIREIYNVNTVTSKLFLSELPEKIYHEAHKSSNIISESKKFIYDNIESSIIYEFRNTFFDFCFEIRNLSGIERYQNIFKHRKRSVAEHQWFVSLIAIFFDYYYNDALNLESLLVKSLFHDDIELYTGDIISKTKNTLSSTKMEVEKVERYYYNEYYSKLLPHDLLLSFEDNVLNAKDKTLEGEFLSIIDILDTIYESEEEIILGNNSNFSSIKENSLEKLSSYTDKYDFIRFFLP